MVFSSGSEWEPDSQGGCLAFFEMMQMGSVYLWDLLVHVLLKDHFISIFLSCLIGVFLLLLASCLPSVVTASHVT